MTEHSSSDDPSRREVLQATASLGVLSFTAVSTVAADSDGYIQGTIRDINGNSLGGATVRVINDGSGAVVATLTADRSGDFLVRVEPGSTYIVTASKSGYQSGQTRQIAIESGETQTADVVLRPSSGDTTINAQSGLAYNDGYVYGVSNGQIIVYDFTAKERIDSFDAPAGDPEGLAYGDGSLWFSDGASQDYDGEILRLDPETGRVESRISTSYDPEGLTFAEGSLWVVDITTNDIVEYSPTGEELSRFDIQGPTGVTFGKGLAHFDGTLWLGTGDDNPLFKFSTDGTYEGSTGDGRPHNGLTTTDTELLGPDPNGRLTVLRTLADDPDDSAVIEGEVTDESGTPISDATVRLPLADNEEITTKTGDSGRFTLSLSGLEVPFTVTIFVEKRGFVTGSTNTSPGETVDIMLVPTDESRVTISPAIHHIGDGYYSGSINSQFQEPVEGSSWQDRFSLTPTQASATDATLVFTIRGAQRPNPVLINGSEVGEIETSARSGDASEGTLSVPVDTLRAGDNTIRVQAAENPNDPTDIDDFEISNIRLRLTLPTDEDGDAFSLDISPAPAAIPPGESGSITVTLTNETVSEPGVASLRLSSLPRGVDVTDVQTAGTVLDQNDGLDVGEGVSFGVTADPPAKGESVSMELTVEVSESVSLGALGELAVTGDLNASDPPTEQTASVTIRAEARGIPTEDPTFKDVLDVISAYNSGETYNGVTVTFQDVLEVVSGFNR